jgi:hypothetical protein
MNFHDEQSTPAEIVSYDIDVSEAVSEAVVRAVAAATGRAAEPGLSTAGAGSSP